MYFYTCFCILLIAFAGTSVDARYRRGKIQPKQDETCFNENAQSCFEQQQAVSPFDYEDNIAEFAPRVTQYTNISCSEPCFSIFNTFYKCINDAELLQFSNFTCQQHNNEYCFPLVTKVLVANGTIDETDNCDNLQDSKQCSSKCKTAAQKLVDDDKIGCCGVLYFTGMYVSDENGNSTDLNPLDVCDIDTRGVCNPESESSGATSSLKVLAPLAVILMTLVSIFL